MDASLAVRRAVAARRGELLAMIRLRARGGVDAEEVLQAALLRALSKSDQVQDPERADAWVQRVVYHEIVDEFRRQRRSNHVSIDEVDPSGAAEERLDCSCVLAQAKQLHPSHAKILQRVVIDGVPVSQAAVELGITANNAMVRLHRARKALVARLAAHCGTTSPRSCSECGCEERGCCPPG